jgi:ATP-binding cassette, subfamily B, bacterial MsbA
LVGEPTHRRLLGLFKPHRAGFAFALVLLGLHSAIPGLLVILIERILDDALIRKDSGLVAVLPFALAGLYALNGLLSYGRGMLTRGISWKVVTQLRARLFGHMLGQGVPWRQKEALGQLLSQLQNDVSSIQYAVSAIITAVQKPLTVAGLLAAAFWMNPILAAAGTAALPLAAWPIHRFGRRLRHESAAELGQQAKVQTLAAETLQGFEVVKSSQAEDFHLRRFSHANEELRRRKMAAIASQLLPGPVVEFIAAGGVGLAIYFGGRMVLDDQLQPGELVAFLFAMGLLNAPLKGLSEMRSLWQRSMAGAESVFSRLDIPGEEKGGRELSADKVELVIEKLRFDYGEGPVLDGLEFRIRPGETVALAGPSGSGKSTLAALVQRLYEPEGGSIRINGREVGEYSMESLRRHISVVGQHPFLFHSTVRENLCLGRDFSALRIERALELASALEFVSRLPKGLETVLQEGGMRLSGGQRQRLCIARALLRNAPLLILDEPTSNLDAASEAEVSQALRSLMENRSVLMVTHSPRMLEEADRIIAIGEVAFPYGLQGDDGADITGDTPS